MSAARRPLGPGPITPPQSSKDAPEGSRRLPAEPAVPVPTREAGWHPRPAGAASLRRILGPGSKAEQ
ncbi:hypothetical protein [Streptomyces sp. NPDC001380]|uniref:hypothetical protein n=1 Tax=Streptomyces sp. NPDC001380 TaxID=3364566 RepID=UPI0036C2A9A1